MRRSLNRFLAVLSPLAITCAIAAPLSATTAPVLDLYGTSLTVDPTPYSSHQPAFARWEQRGVDIDGTLRLPVPLGGPSRVTRWAGGILRDARSGT